MVYVPRPLFYIILPHPGLPAIGVPVKMYILGPCLDRTHTHTYTHVRTPKTRAGICLPLEGAIKTALHPKISMDPLRNEGAPL